MAKKRKFIKKMKGKLTFITGVVVVCFAVVAGKLIYINVKEGKKYEQRVLTQQGYSSKVIPYKRGDILDANGNVLATTKKVYNLVLEPKNILEKEEGKTATINALKMYFGYTDSEIMDLLADKESYYTIAKKGLEYSEVKEYMDFVKSSSGSDVVGVYFEEEYKRIYPNNELACHLLGFTVGGNVGMYGVEENYNEFLNGYNGREYSYLNDEYGLTDSIEPPVDGYNLITSIDANVQKIVQKQVEAYMKKEGAENVSVLVMNPKNSNVVALYNSHSFDLNDAYDLDACRYQFKTEEEFKSFKKNASDEETVDALNKVWRNFAISDVFEPGSTYKTFTISGALEENVVTENSTFFCDGGEQVAGYEINCHAWAYGGHGQINLSQALEGSCNDALMQIAAKEGASTFDKYQVLFGFGQRSGIDIPGEPGSDDFEMVVFHEDTLNETELATSSFGQGVCVSMIQLATAFCSVINGGNYYAPTVVQRMEDSSGNIISNMDNTFVRKTISEDVSATMREQLHQVVENGTGKKARVEGYTIGGKTGTAEKLPRKNGKYLISFIGFAPVEDPQIVIYIVVDEPHVEDQSSNVASSYLFADIATELFPYLNIYKTNDEKVDNTNAVDQPGTPVYGGDNIPENDVAGGEDNPYVNNSEAADGDNDTSESEPSDDNDSDEASVDDNNDEASNDDENSDDDTSDEDYGNDESSGEDYGDDEPSGEDYGEDQPDEDYGDDQYTPEEDYGNEE